MILTENIRQNKKRLVLFVQEGGEAFLDDLKNAFSEFYELRFIIIKQGDDLKIIEEWMHWADICWFEWCDRLIVYGSRLPVAGKRVLICRLHSYEAFTNFPSRVNWNNVDKIIFIARHLQNYVLQKFNIKDEKTIVIPNGINLNKWSFSIRSPGFNVAYVGFINYKKGPMLLLHTFKALNDVDDRFTLHIAGQFQDPRDRLYFNQMIEELRLENNLIFHGWQKDLNQWLEDKNCILCTSVLESQNMSVMQAMAKGIKPVIHNFVGAKEIYPADYLWNTIEEAVTIIGDKNYRSSEYRNYIEDNYSSDRQIQATISLLSDLLSNAKNAKGFNYRQYWRERLNAAFNIEGVGYSGLGKIYNEILYKNRMDMLDSILERICDKIDGKSILELGPGTGIFTDYFFARGVEKYCAIDIVEKSVTELSNRFRNYHFKQGDISDSNIYEGKFDLIFAAAVLLHITNEENYKSTIINISKHLKDSGVCIVFDPVSVINSKSVAAHVVIRDVKYINKVLENNSLELAAMLPIAFFMNYPFDNALIGEKGNYALEAFNLTGKLFSDKSLGNNEKQLMGEYLSNREKILLHNKNFGLSEKVLVIHKKGAKQFVDLNLNTVLNIDEINKNISLLYKNLQKKELLKYENLNKIDNLINYFLLF